MESQNVVIQVLLDPFCTVPITGILGSLVYFFLWKSRYPYEYDEFIDTVYLFCSTFLIGFVLIGLILIVLVICLKQFRKFIKNTIVTLLGGHIAEDEPLLTKIIEDLESKNKDLEKRLKFDQADELYLQERVKLQLKLQEKEITAITAAHADKINTMNNEINKKNTENAQLRLDIRRLSDDLSDVATNRNKLSNRLWNAEYGHRQMSTNFEDSEEKNKKLTVECGEKLAAKDRLLKKSTDRLENMTKEFQAKLQEKQKTVEDLETKLIDSDRKEHAASVVVSLTNEQNDKLHATVETLNYRVNELETEELGKLQETIETLHYRIHELETEELGKMKKTLTKSKKLRKGLAAKNGELVGQNDELVNKNGELASKNDELVNKNGELVSKNDELVGTVTALGEKNTALEAKITTLEEKKDESLLEVLKLKRRYEGNGKARRGKF